MRGLNVGRDITVSLPVIEVCWIYMVLSCMYTYILHVRGFEEQSGFAFSPYSQGWHCAKRWHFDILAYERYSRITLTNAKTKEIGC